MSGVRAPVSLATDVIGRPVVVCDDGMVYALDYFPEEVVRWKELPPIPGSVAHAMFSHEAVG